MLALLFGRTLLRERIWDMERLMDYAAARPEIDDSRVIRVSLSLRVQLRPWHHETRRDVRRGWPDCT